MNGIDSWSCSASGKGVKTPTLPKTFVEYQKVETGVICWTYVGQQYHCWFPVPSSILDGHQGGCPMKKSFGNAALFCILALAFAPFSHAQTSNPKIYIAPQGGFESYLAGAFTKKNVPAQLLQTEEGADYILSPAPVDQKPESTDARTTPVLWAYNVHKGGSSNFQSSAEACAKHLKKRIQHPGNYRIPRLSE